jgi:pantoate--beta-alanine ligase
MGALHAGHLALVSAAAHDDHAVAVSIFVNPAQFAPTEDLSRYPRPFEADVAASTAAGAELIFAPDADQVYPDGFATTISLAGPAEGLEGAARPTHFAGVATVVAKLLLAVRPDRAVFGQKDAQQVAVVRRMMGDLHLDDIELVVHPIVREDDGLAMSSRNVYLSEADRVAARALSRGLRTAVLRASAGERDGARLAREAWATMDAEPGCVPHYASVVDPDTFQPISTLTSGPALLCIAAQVGPARLIDNAFLPTT